MKGENCVFQEARGELHVPWGLGFFEPLSSLLLQRFRTTLLLGVPILTPSLDVLAWRYKQSEDWLCLDVMNLVRVTRFHYIIYLYKHEMLFSYYMSFGWSARVRICLTLVPSTWDIVLQLWSLSVCMCVSTGGNNTIIYKIYNGFSPNRFVRSCGVGKIILMNIDSLAYKFVGIFVYMYKRVYSSFSGSTLSIW